MSQSEGYPRWIGLTRRGVRALRGEVMKHARKAAKVYTFQRAVMDGLRDREIAEADHEGHGYSHMLLTKAGTLYLTPYKDCWIACKFLDVANARHVLGEGPGGRLNPYSGKWNFHYNDNAGIAEAKDFFHHLDKVRL